MRRLHKVGLGVGGAVVGYLLLLLVGGWILGGVVARGVRDRLAASLDAEATVGAAEVDLLRGGAALRGLEVEREHDGHLTLAVDALELDLAPLGAVLWDREPRAVRVKGGRLEISGLGVLRLPPRRKRPPVTVGALHLEDVRLALVATGLLPGLARVELVIERARSRTTVLRTALSWIFTLEELVARLELPAGVSLRLAYRDQVMSVTGGPFGATPLELPLVMPAVDAQDEVGQLAALGKELAKQLALAEARRLLQRAPSSSPPSP